MNDESSWIFPFVQETLLRHIEHGDDEVEDDGTSLTFSNNGNVYTATIQDWPVGTDGKNKKPVLKDANHSIEAVFPQDQQRSLHQKILLLDFKLVLTYNPSPVTLHLHVNDCHIDPEIGTSQDKLPKGKLSKAAEIKKLMQNMQGKIKIIQSSGGTKTRLSAASRKSASNKSNNPSNDGDKQPKTHGLENNKSGGNGEHENMLGDGESQPLASQLPSGVLELASQAPGTHLHGASERRRQPGRPSLENVNNDSSVSAEKLRELLSRRSSKDGPVESPTPRTTPKKVAARSTSNSHPGLSRSPLREMSTTNRTENVSSDEGGSVASQPRELASQTRAVDSSLLGRHDPQLPSKKRARDEETDEVSQLDTQNQRGSEPKGAPSPKKRQRTGPASQPSAQVPENESPTQQMANDPPVRPRHSANSVNSPSRPQSVELDPWDGFNGITDRDITIPKEQKVLFSDPKTLCWMPPKGHDPWPQGHVPRSLLDVWNDTIERRHRNANSQHVISEPSNSPTKSRSISPNQESDVEEVDAEEVDTHESDADSDSSAPLSPWASSPVRPHPSRSMLPPSSPVAHFGFVGKKPKSKLPAKGQTLDSASPINAKSSRVVSQSSPRNNEKPHVNSTPSKPATNKGHANFKGQSPAQSSQSHEAESNSQLFSQVHATSSPIRNPGRNSPIPSSNPLPVPGEDDSDEDMDTSVPFALGENIPDPTQSSQVEERLRSSGASHPGGNNECVQVAVTPRIGAPHTERPHENSQPAALSPRHHSSPGQQDSSQSRILNTFPLHTSNETEGFTGSSTSGGPSQEAQIQVDVLLTQQHASSMASQSQSQRISNQSQTDIVLDSSGPAQRHQDFSALATQQSSLEMPSSHESTLSQLHMPTQESLPEERRPGGSANSPVVISPPRAEALVARQSPPASMGSVTQSQRAEPTENDTLNTQSTQVLARRQGFLNKLENTARDVYRQFCSTYSAFSGNFEHFTLMCNKLRTIRQEGKLQRSFLWDDFVIMYLHQYAPYLDKQFTQDSETLSYEEFFLKTFSKPYYKKRSLTAQGIEEAASQARIAQEEASQYASKIEVSPPRVVPGDAAQGIATRPFFAGSLVEQLANFDTRSINRSPPPDLSAPGTPQSPRIKFEGESDLSVFLTANNTPTVTTYTQNNTPLQAQSQVSPLAPPLMSPQALFQASPQVLSRPVPQALPAPAPQGQPQASPRASSQLLSQTPPQALPQPSPQALPQPSPQALPQTSHRAMSQAPTQALPRPVPQTLQFSAPEAPPKPVVSRAPPQRSSQRAPEVLPQAHLPAPPTEDVDMDEVPETDPEDAYEDGDTFHETASVELGDESFMYPARTQPQSRAEDVQMSEAPPAPSTASDTDSSEYESSESENENWFLSLRHIRPKEPVWSDGPTEFKRWSEAHQNLPQTRRRRGGHKILLDEKGVIRRPIYR